MVKKLLHLEGLVFFIAALYLYQQLNGNWIVFALLIFLPDISMIGYVKDKKLGAAVYNLVHNYALAIIVIASGALIQNSTVVSVGLILFAHVAMDRFFGYGLKYPTSFKDTHMQKV
jgi:hypothetical protein